MRRREIQRGTGARGGAGDEVAAALRRLAFAEQARHLRGQRVDAGERAEPARLALHHRVAARRHRRLGQRDALAVRAQEQRRGLLERAGRSEREGDVSGVAQRRTGAGPRRRVWQIDLGQQPGARPQVVRPEQCAREPCRAPSADEVAQAGLLDRVARRRQQHRPPAPGEQHVPAGRPAGRRPGALLRERRADAAPRLVAVHFSAAADAHRSSHATWSRGTRAA